MREDKTREEIKISRRRFIGTALAAAALTPIAGKGLLNAAHAGDLPKVSEDDPTAKALGYVHDVKSVDTSKFPKRAGEAGANQFCHNCSLYQAAEGEEWGKCSIFPGKLVKGEGWCNAWVAKA